MSRDSKGAVAASGIIGTRPDRDDGVGRELPVRRTDRRWPRPIRLALLTIVPVLLWLIILTAAGIL